MDKKDFKFINENAYNAWKEDKLPFQLESKHATNDAWLNLGKKPDMVNNPAHYTSGRVEAIEVIEDAILNAPTNMDGFLQGQVLKYMLRLWHKIDAKEDAEKARWYLNRLIDSLNCESR